jgi:hypothetical protein
MASCGAPDFYGLLADAVVRSPAECSRRVAIADSKALYKAGLGVRALERGVLAALGVWRGSGTLPANTIVGVATQGELIDVTRADVDGRRRELSCHCGDELRLPLETTDEELAEVAELLAGVCEANDVTLAGLRARLVFPTEFNALVDEFGTKGAALSHVTLALVRQLVDELVQPRRLALRSEDSASRLTLPERRTSPQRVACGDLNPEPCAIYLDKHGGRNRYAALVQHHFAAGWIDTIVESRVESRYHWEQDGRPIEAIFRVECEDFLPTALASMTAKYHRELAMQAFNAFWTSRVPELRPTAGYPMDSHRFRADIAAAQRELGIEDRALWRSR